MAEPEADFSGGGSFSRVPVNAPQVDVPAEATNEARVVATVLSPETVSNRQRGMLPWAASSFATLWLAGTLIAAAAAFCVACSAADD